MPSFTDVITALGAAVTAVATSFAGYYAWRDRIGDLMIDWELSAPATDEPERYRVSFIVRSTLKQSVDLTRIDVKGVERAEHGDQGHVRRPSSWPATALPFLYSEIPPDGALRCSALVWPSIKARSSRLKFSFSFERRSRRLRHIKKAVTVDIPAVATETAATATRNTPSKS